jgi:hypothetical protein
MVFVFQERQVGCSSRGAEKVHRVSVWFFYRMEREVQDGRHVVNTRMAHFVPFIRSVKEVHSQHGRRYRPRCREKLRGYFHRTTPREDDGALLLWRFIRRTPHKVVWDVVGGEANHFSPAIFSHLICFRFLFLSPFRF